MLPSLSGLPATGAAYNHFYRVIKRRPVPGAVYSALPGQVTDEHDATPGGSESNIFRIDRQLVVAIVASDERLKEPQMLPFADALGRWAEFLKYRQQYGTRYEVADVAGLSLSADDLTYVTRDSYPGLVNEVPTDEAVHIYVDFQTHDPSQRYGTPEAEEAAPKRFVYMGAFRVENDRKRLVPHSQYNGYSWLQETPELQRESASWLVAVASVLKKDVQLSAEERWREEAKEMGARFAR